MKNMTFECKWTQKINYFSEVLAPKDVNNTVVLCKVIHFVVKQTRLFVKADGYHFEQLL
jgi:hypothetical protein